MCAYYDLKKKKHVVNFGKQGFSTAHRTHIGPLQMQ